MQPQSRPFLAQSIHNSQAWRLPGIVGPSLKGKAQDSDSLIVQDPKRIAEFFNKHLRSLFVDLLNFLQQGKINAILFRQVNKGSQVFGETIPAKTNSRLQE